MTRDEVAAALEAQPFDTDVVANVGGYLIEVVKVGYDEKRHSIVLELLPEDTGDVLATLSASI